MNERAVRQAGRKRETAGEQQSK